MISLAPPLLVAITGKPAANASNIEIPNASLLE